MTDDAQAPLKAFEKTRDFFVGVDSDGCAFDTMEIKHKECFAPNIVNHWSLQAVSKYAREAAEFVNLYSQWRGVNRWPAVKMVLDLVRERPEVEALGAQIPEGKAIQAFIDSGYKTSNEGLWQWICEAAHPSDAAWQAELQTMFLWTEGVNATIADMVHGVPPFPFVRESLAKLNEQADVICVSATPGEALNREWVEHDIAQYAAVIAGQEMGKKAEHICLANGGQIDGKGGVSEQGTRYAPDHILMIGDAPGDMKAGRANNALFFPINPGDEEASWELFHNEAIDRFFTGTYAGDYEADLIQKFHARLPDTPPWKR